MSPNPEYVPLPLPEDKDHARAQIAKDVDDYLKHGGQITDLGRGVDAIELMPPVTGNVKRRGIEQTQARIARAKSRARNRT